MNYDLNEIIYSLTKAVDGVNPNFNYHSRMVAYTALSLFERCNIRDELKETVFLSALLHDIGFVKLYQHELKSFLMDLPCFSYQHEDVGARLIKKYKQISHLYYYIKNHHKKCSEFDSEENDNSIITQILNLADRISINFAIECDCYFSISKSKNRIIEFVKNNKRVIFSDYVSDLFLDELANVDEFWFTLFSIKDFCYQKIKDIFALQPKYINEIELIEITQLFGEIIDNHSQFTKCHSLFVANISYLIGCYFNFSEREKNMLYMSGYLHDIGKIYVPKEILDKPSKLNSEEREIIKLHPFFTNNVLSDISSFNEVREIASNHHERLDGTGYPRRLKQKDISIYTRILTIADIMASYLENRPYREALSFDDTIDLLVKEGKEGKIDGEIVDRIRKFKTELKDTIYKISGIYYCEVKNE